MARLHPRCLCIDHWPAMKSFRPSRHPEGARHHPDNSCPTQANMRERRRILQSALLRARRHVWPAALVLGELPRRLREPSALAVPHLERPPRRLPLLAGVDHLRGGASVNSGEGRRRDSHDAATGVSRVMDRGLSYHGVVVVGE